MSVFDSVVDKICAMQWSEQAMLKALNMVGSLNCKDFENLINKVGERLFGSEPEDDHIINAILQQYPNCKDEAIDLLLDFMLKNANPSEL